MPSSGGGAQFMDSFHKQAEGCASPGDVRFGKVDIPSEAFTVMLKRD